MKCFRKSGIVGSDFSVVGRSFEEQDPFDDIDAQEELEFSPES